MTTYDNVIIFGAGASYDANIPLLSNFVDKMWEFAIRGKNGEQKINEEDQKLLNDANNIRIRLENYNSRSNFNSRNIEDLLSILAFDKSTNGKKDFQILVKAISKTIEISTNVPYRGNYARVFKTIRTKNTYFTFWDNFFEVHQQGYNIALLTFNYDLTLERSLFEYCMNTTSTLKTQNFTVLV